MTTLRDLRQQYEEKIGRELTTQEFNTFYSKIRSMCINYIKENCKCMYIRSEWNAIDCGDGDYDSDVIIMFKLGWNDTESNGFYMISEDNIIEVYDSYVDFTNYFIKCFKEITEESD